MTRWVQECRRLYLADHLLSREPERFVEQWPTMPQRWRELNPAGLVELLGCFFGDGLVHPVRPAVDGPPFVVQLRVEQHQACDFLWPVRGVVDSNATGEARAGQRHLLGVGDFPYVGQR